MNAHTTDFDASAFAADLDALRKRTLSELCADDLAHRGRIERWGRACTALGLATAWMVPNPVSALLLSQGRITRWTMVAHHTIHRGYDRVPGVAPSQTSKQFAKGWRRAVDWLDWIDPQAWHHEHDMLHHYRLGEDADPDFVERNVEWLRQSPLPRIGRLLVVAFFMMTWKWSYYAPNTLQALKVDQARRSGETWDDPGLVGMFARPELWWRCLMPYALVQFVLLPLLFLPLGMWAAANVAINSLLAEIIANVHGFIIVVTNHAGDDLYAFSGRTTDKGEFYRRQVMGSTNFTTGGDLNDFGHGWLNYQIEHHLFPDLPMRQYQRIQPEVKAICEAHGVPYVQESVFERLRKTVAILVGDASQRRLTPVDASVG